MPYQVKPELPVQSLHLITMAAMFDAHKMMYDFGYRGSFSTTTTVFPEQTGLSPVESGRFDMSMNGNVPISAALGDVILYRLNPPVVVACMTHDEFAANYEAV